MEGDDNVNVNDAIDGLEPVPMNQISKQPVHLSAEIEEELSTYAVQDLNLWYLENHGVIGTIVRGAFDSTMIQNPNPGRPMVIISGDNDNKTEGTSGQDGGIVVDDTIQQLFTASFTCPITNERFKAGRLPGCFDIDNQFFYSKKKTAFRAVSAVVLSHKLDANDNGNSTVLLDDDRLTTTATNTNTNDKTSFRKRLKYMYAEKFNAFPRKIQTRQTKVSFAGKENGGIWWTAEFVCPFTGQTCEAADLPAGITNSIPKMKVAGQIWYRAKSDAIRASYYTALDSIDWDAKPDVTGEDDDSKIITSTTIHAAQLGQSDDNSRDILRPVVFWYTEQKQGRHVGGLDISIEDNFIVTGGTDDEGRELWTASFLCPLTGERFDSGTINDTDAVRTAEIDNLNWYTKKDTALKAASQRAYDSFKYRETGVKDPRFCREDPTELVTETIRLSTIPQEEVIDSNDESDSDSEDDDNDAIDNLIASDDDDDEEDFIIEVIPQQLNASQGLESSSSKTLDIIAQAWIDSTALSTIKANPKHELENLKNVIGERQRTIIRAMEWVSQQKNETSISSSDRTQFDVKGQICNLKIANAILSSLAESHQRIPFASRPAGVEECAAAILESLWSSQSTVPDARSYALYLKCLEGETPNDVADRALEIVIAMESGQVYNERLLPEPNNFVYSSLAQLKALLGVYPLVENSSTYESLDRSIHLSQLSVMSHNPGVFDIDIATQYINQMRTLSEINCCPSLQPDIEVYNAPLRWSGGSLWSRLYSRAIPWDSYSEIFQDGFKSESSIDVLREQAERIEEWIEIMNTISSSDDALCPNIETYESLIQAWVRCGSLESLMRAETIARNLIAGDYPGVKPRLQSFYPIIGAWTYSGHGVGPQNVDSWIDLMLTQELESQIDPRLSFPDLPIMAQISLQRQLSKASGDPLDSMSCTLESAAKCSKLLESTIERHKNSPDVRMRSDTFMLVINAWYNAASAAISGDNLEEARQCSREIQKVVNLFDDMLVWFYRVDDDTKDGTKSKMSSLLNQAPSVYGAQIAALVKLQTALDNSQNIARNDDGITKQLIFIEEKIRRLEEFKFFLPGNGKEHGSQNGNIEENAITPFPSEALMVDSSCKNWTDFIDLSLDCLEKETRNFSAGEADFIRLCMLITRVTFSAAPVVLNSESKDRIIGKLVDLLETYSRDNQDREVVVSALVQSLKKRSETLKGKGASNNTLHGSESQYGANEESGVNEDQDSDSVHTHTKRKIRRKRSRGNELHTSSYSRTRVPNRSVLRRPRPHQAKANEF